MKAIDLINELPKDLAKKAQKLLDSSPLARKIISEIDRKVDDARRIRVEQRKAIPGEHAQLIAQTAEEAAKASKAVEAAEAELRRCRDVYAVAAQRFHGAQAGLDRALALNSAELIATADPRLNEFVRILGSIANAIEGNLKFDKLYRKDYGTGRVESMEISNFAEVMAVANLVKECADEVRNMRLQSLSTEEITEALNGICERLKWPLDQFQFAPPVVTPATVEIPQANGRPLRVGPENQDVRDKMLSDMQAERNAKARRGAGRPALH